MSVEKKLCIQGKNIKYKYNEVNVIKDVNFDIYEGDYIGLIGPNGGGKSTLMKIILGIIEPDKGEITIYGEPLNEFRDFHLIGYVPQRLGGIDFSFPASVHEIIQTGRIARRGMLKSFNAEDEAMVNEAMETVGVTHLRDRRIGGLSGGEQHKVYIARALAAKPKILILDEPLAGVDITSQEKFYALLEKLNNGGITIILISHDVSVVAHQAKQVMCLNKTLVCHGAVEKTLNEDNLKQLYGKELKHILHQH